MGALPLPTPGEESTDAEGPFLGSYDLHPSLSVCYDLPDTEQKGEQLNAHSEARLPGFNLSPGCVPLSAYSLSLCAWIVPVLGSDEAVPVTTVECIAIIGHTSPWRLPEQGCCCF